MDYSSAHTILIVSNSDGEDAFWMQLLVIVILAVSWGVYSLVKTRANKFKQQQQPYYPDGGQHAQTRMGWQIKRLKELKDRYIGILLKKARLTAVIEKAVLNFGGGGPVSREKLRKEPSTEKQQDLVGGMEMLERGFLVKIVENTRGANNNDVTMRKLSFNELVRRGELREADSKALKVYAVDKGSLYGKHIQCGAIKELAERTALRPG